MVQAASNWGACLSFPSPKWSHYIVSEVKWHIKPISKKFTLNSTWQHSSNPFSLSFCENNFAFLLFSAVFWGQKFFQQQCWHRVKNVFVFSRKEKKSYFHLWRSGSFELFSRPNSRSRLNFTACCLEIWTVEGIKVMKVLKIHSNVNPILWKLFPKRNFLNYSKNFLAMLTRWYAIKNRVDVKNFHKSISELKCYMDLAFTKVDWNRLKVNWMNFGSLLS